MNRFVYIPQSLLKGVNPISRRRMHPYHRQAVYLNIWLMVVGCINLLLSIVLPHVDRDVRKVIGTCFYLTVPAWGGCLGLTIARRLKMKNVKNDA